MRTVILVWTVVLAAVLLAASSAEASEKTDVITTLKQYVSSFNKWNKDAMDAACGPQVIIIDEFPPHAWQGATASADWRNDYETFVKNHGITDVNIPFREPSHIEITGDHAYVVMPTILTYKQHGKPDTEAGAVWTFALQKFSAGWRIMGWAWAEGH